MNSISQVSVRPSIQSWRKGKRSDERGWTFNGVSLSVSEITNSRSFAELQNKGVPVSVCDSAKKSGYAPGELDDYLDEQGYR